MTTDNQQPTTSNQQLLFGWSIVGHENIVEYLETSILNNKLTHAYLFHGPGHIGKRAVAQKFISSILCEARFQKKDVIEKDTKYPILPCKKCVSCKEFERNIHPDVYWLKKEKDEKRDALKKNISIKQIRQLHDRLAMHSFLRGYKIAVIEGAEALSEEAANALLKTLEEPTPQTIILLLASKIEALPSTIISRCQVLKFGLVRQDKISRWLQKIGVQKEEAEIFSSLSLGKPGRALSFFEDKDNFLDYKKKAEEFIEIIKENIIRKFTIIENFLPRKMSVIETTLMLNEILDIWESLLRDLILIKNSSKSNITFRIANIFIKEKLEKISGKYDNLQIVRLIKEIKKTREYLSQNVNPRLIMENLVLNF